MCYSYCSIQLCILTYDIVTVIKLNKSGKAILIIDDEGRMYQTSVVFMLGLLNGKSKHGFITTSRLPFNSAPGRFKPSELWDPNGLFQGDNAKTLDLKSNTDGLSNKANKKKIKKSITNMRNW